MKKFIIKQINDIKIYGAEELLRKLNLFFKAVLTIPLYLIAVILCFLIRLLSFWIIIRIEKFPSGNYGDFANNPAIYYCKKKLKIGQPSKKHIDFMYIYHKDKIYNKQLARMWKRKFNFFSSYFLDPINRVNRFFPGWKTHSIEDITSAEISRDLDFVFEKYQPLEFTQEEEIYGKNLLNKFGLKNGDKFVCLAVRDNAYELRKIPARHRDWSYHDYRNHDIDNFILAAEELTRKGYFVFRMGVVANKPIKSKNSKIIDYANSSLRNDFMDVFLGAKCSFCLSTGLGFEEVPHIFRRPIIFLSLPFGQIRTHTDKNLFLLKTHYLKKENRRLTLSEIFSSGLAFAFDTKIFDQVGVKLIDNTPEEIKDVAVEMVEYLEQNKKLSDEEEELQKTFKNLYSSNMLKYGHQFFKNLDNHPLHGCRCCFSQIRCRFSTKFLKNNRDWLR